MELARIGQEAEHKFAGVRCGLLDQVTSLFARKGQAVFLDCRSSHVDRVPVGDTVEFVIVQSGVKHALADGAYNDRRAECEQAATALGVGKLREATEQMVRAAEEAGRLSGAPLKRAKHVVGENSRVARAVEALRSGDLGIVGDLMNASHESSRVLFENSCAELDFLAAEAQRIPGCLGARLTGGGFGGAVLAMVGAGSAGVFVATIEELAGRAWGRKPACLAVTAGGA
jgi:galactokinase